MKEAAAILTAAATIVGAISRVMAELDRDGGVRSGLLSEKLKMKEVKRNERSSSNYFSSGYYHWSNRESGRYAGSRLIDCEI